MCIGKFGALVNIPTHGSAFAVPIDANNVLEIISETQETINRFSMKILDKLIPIIIGITPSTLSSFKPRPKAMDTVIFTFVLT
jgi:hypothetical protein